MNEEKEHSIIPVIVFSALGLLAGLSDHEVLPFIITGGLWFCCIFIYREKKRRVSIGAFLLIAALYVRVFGFRL